MNLVKELISEIKKKKELQPLEDEFIKDLLQSNTQNIKLLQKKRKELTLKQLKKTREYKKIIKEVRKTLREIYGVFKEKKYHKKEQILKNLKSLKDTENHKKILTLHKSTKERLPYYEEVYKKIFAITGKPKKILDLGCGLNPFSTPWMGLKNVTYLASELTKEDCKFIQKYFKKVGIRGKTFQLNLTKIKTLPKADICFLLKTLDTLETLQKNISKKLIKKITAKHIIVSFPTKTLGAKKNIRTKRLAWFEKIIHKYSYKTFETPNEKFYIIQKKLRKNLNK